MTRSSDEDTDRDADDERADNRSANEEARVSRVCLVCSQSGPFLFSPIEGLIWLSRVSAESETILAPKSQ